MLRRSLLQKPKCNRRIVSSRITVFFRIMIHGSANANAKAKSKALVLKGINPLTHYVCID